MGLFRGHRARAQEKFERELGVGEGVAALGAIALHPFVMGSPQPKSTSFISTVRKDSHRFARDVRGVRSGDDLRELARANVASWASAARVAGEEHYASEFTIALANAGHAGNGAAAMPVGGAASSREMNPPSRLLAAERMASMSAKGVPKEEILENEQAITTLVVALAGRSPKERRAWFEGLSHHQKAIGQIVLASVEADERASAEIGISPELETALSDLAAQLVEDGSPLQQAVDQRMQALESAEHHYATALAGHDPDRARDVVLSETGDRSLANEVAHRLWVDSWATLSDAAFVEIADETMADFSPNRTDYRHVVVALDAERERRGLPLPPPLIDLSAKVENKGDWSDPESRADAARGLHWELNTRVASFRASEAEILDCHRAEAESDRAQRILEPENWDRYGRWRARED